MCGSASGAGPHRHAPIECDSTGATPANRSDVASVAGAPANGANGAMVAPDLRPMSALRVVWA